jgi:glycosyltransferase involved in cell wall biosynthesis
MKVMMFGNEIWWSGQTHVHCKRYIRLLQLAGCDVTFVEYRHIRPPAIPNVGYRRYPHRYRSLEKILGIGAAHLLRRQSMRLLWRLVRPDICHAHWIGDELCHIARAGLRPLVATAWGSDLNVPAKAAVSDTVRERTAAALRLIDHLIVDSDDMAATAEKLAGKKLNTTLLPIGIDTHQFRPGLREQRNDWRKKLRIDPDAIVLISPRQLAENYRHSEVIRAFAALERQHRRQTFLIIRTFGHRFGVSKTELQRLADNLNVSDQLRWVGDVEYAELPGLYAASDLAVNFPIMDAFPVTFLECFACGVPIISNRLESYASNGVSPYLMFVEDDSVGALTTTMEAAIGRLDQLQALAAEAREHVVRNFDERVTARILKQIYEAVLGQKEQRRKLVPDC